MIAVEPTVSLKIDEAVWKKTLEDVTSLYKQYPDVQSVTASAKFSAINEYLVNSEGTVTRFGKTTYSVQLSSSAQAADGMRLSRSPAFMVARVEELPTRDALMGRSKEMLETVVALRQAPMVEEEYRGPVLFAADAADDIVASLIGAKRAGAKAAAWEAKSDDGSICDQLQNARAAELSVGGGRSDAEVFQGKSLVGSYAVDSEGVKAKAVNAIENGDAGELPDRPQPIRDFSTSNGHGRARREISGSRP